jgi:hypothetical protein
MKVDVVYNYDRENNQGNPNQYLQDMAEAREAKDTGWHRRKLRLMFQGLSFCKTEEHVASNLCAASMYVQAMIRGQAAEAESRKFNL